MVRAGLLDGNQHENKCLCASKKSADFSRCIIHSYIDNISPHFEWYGGKPIIHESTKFGCDIYPITSSPKNLYDIKE